jgi:hypothetical protein
LFQVPGSLDEALALLDACTRHLREAQRELQRAFVALGRRT